jgi:rubredoxin
MPSEQRGAGQGADSPVTLVLADAIIASEDTEEEQGEAEPLNWACTNCGYRVEGELPEKCPDCGAEKEMFDEVPVPGY